MPALLCHRMRHPLLLTDSFCQPCTNWKAPEGIKGTPSGVGHLPPSGHRALAPTTRVNGRFQDTMPTNPENAS